MAKTATLANQVIEDGSGMSPTNIENAATKPTPVINERNLCTSNPPVRTVLE